MEDQTQLHAVVLHSGRSKNEVSSQIVRLGGALASDIGQECSVLAFLTDQQVIEISKKSGVRLVAPVGVNHQVKRLRVQLGPDGRPLWNYEVRNNDIFRVDSDAADLPNE